MSFSSEGVPAYKLKSHDQPRSASITVRLVASSVAATNHETIGQRIYLRKAASHVVPSLRTE